MARITITDLHLNSDTENLNELHDGEMKTVEGGQVTRRRPTRNRSASTTDANDTVNNRLSNIDNLLANWRSQIDETMFNLRDQLGNI